MNDIMNAMKTHRKVASARPSIRAMQNIAQSVAQTRKAYKPKDLTEKLLPDEQKMPFSESAVSTASYSFASPRSPLNRTSNS